MLALLLAVVVALSAQAAVATDKEHGGGCYGVEHRNSSGCPHPPPHPKPPPPPPKCSAQNPEILRGNNTQNVLVGSKCDTTFYGKDKGDTISDTSGPDHDTVYAGQGADDIDVHDGQSDANSDTVYCGKGKDTVYADKNDELRGCAKDRIYIYVV